MSFSKLSEEIIHDYFHRVWDKNNNNWQTEFKQWLRNVITNNDKYKDTRSYKRYTRNEIESATNEG